MHVRKDDEVIVIAGNDKGRTGKVVRVIRSTGRVVVEGVNLRWKHRKPSQQSPKGERVQRESSIHASNVMHLDPATGKGVRRRVEEKDKARAKQKREKKATAGAAQAAGGKGAKKRS
jgi:large subunit ribosomal protein L24